MNNGKKNGEIEFEVILFQAGDIIATSGKDPFELEED